MELSSQKKVSIETLKLSLTANTLKCGIIVQILVVVVVVLPSLKLLKFGN